jgi:hypothetical protein
MQHYDLSSYSRLDDWNRRRSRRRRDRRCRRSLGHLLHLDLGFLSTIRNNFFCLFVRDFDICCAILLRGLLDCLLHCFLYLCPLLINLRNLYHALGSDFEWFDRTEPTAHLDLYFLLIRLPLFILLATFVTALPRRPEPSEPTPTLTKIAHRLLINTRCK